MNLDSFNAKSAETIFGDKLEDEEDTETENKDKTTPNLQVKNVLPRPGNSKDMEIKEKPFNCTTCGEKLRIEETESHECKELSCEHCDKTFKKPANLKKHERKHAVDKSFTCSDCGNKISGSQDSDTRKDKPFRCADCDKKFKRKTPVCQFYRAGHCIFGGQQTETNEIKCKHRHPAACPDFKADKCENKGCNLMHPAPVCTFFLKRKCTRKHCKFTHPKSHEKKPENKVEKTRKSLERKNHSGASDVARDPPRQGHEKKDEQDFLEMIRLMKKGLDQTLGKMSQQIEELKKGQNNNAFPLPQVWAQRR